MTFATCIKCRKQDFERPDKGAYLVSRKVEVLKHYEVDMCGYIWYYDYRVNDVGRYSIWQRQKKTAVF